MLSKKDFVTLPKWPWPLWHFVDFWGPWRVTDELNEIVQYCGCIPLHHPLSGRLSLLKILQSFTRRWVCSKSCCYGNKNGNPYIKQALNTQVLLLIINFHYFLTQYCTLRFANNSMHGLVDINQSSKLVFACHVILSYRVCYPKTDC